MAWERLTISARRQFRDSFKFNNFCSFENFKNLSYSFVLTSNLSVSVIGTKNWMKIEFAIFAIQS